MEPVDLRQRSAGLSWLVRLKAPVVSDRTEPVEHCVDALALADELDSPMATSSLDTFVAISVVGVMVPKKSEPSRVPPYSLRIDQWGAYFTPVP